MAKYCSSCGAQLTDDALFCSSCGTDQRAFNPIPAPVSTSAEPNVIAAQPAAPEQPVPEVVSQGLPPVEASPAKQKKNKKWLRWAIPVASVLVLAIAAALLWKPLLLKFAPETYLNMASKRTFAALAERGEGSPAALIGTAQEILEKGTVDISVDTNDPEIGEIDIDLSMASDQAAKQYAVNGEMQILGQDIDMGLYVDEDVFALKVNPFTNGNYYGLTYDSFDSDIRASAFSSVLEENVITQISDIWTNTPTSFRNL